VPGGGQVPAQHVEVAGAPVVRNQVHPRLEDDAALAMGEDRAFDVLALKVDPRFEPLRDDPRLQAILRDVGLG